MSNFTEAKRRRIFDKYKGRCAYCGGTLKYEEMTIDHIIPKSAGGRDNPGNLNPACKPCNALKCDLSINEFTALARELIGKNEYKLHFDTRKTKNYIFYYKQLEKEQKQKVKKAKQNAKQSESYRDTPHIPDWQYPYHFDPYAYCPSSVEEEYFTSIPFSMDDVKERRAEALITQFCMDYNISVPLFLSAHLPVFSSDSLALQDFTAPVVDMRDCYALFALILSYDILGINDPELLELEKMLLEKIPDITPTKLLQIENEYLIGNLRKSEQKVNQPSS